jgi:hypothetical protein
MKKLCNWRATALLATHARTEVIEKASKLLPFTMP